MAFSSAPQQNTAPHQAKAPPHSTGSTREAPVTKHQQPQSHQPGAASRTSSCTDRVQLKTKPRQAPTVKPQQAQDPKAQAAEKSCAQLSKDKPCVANHILSSTSTSAHNSTRLTWQRSTRWHRHCWNLQRRPRSKLTLCRSLLTVCWRQAREKRAMSFGPW